MSCQNLCFIMSPPATYLTFPLSSQHGFSCCLLASQCKFSVTMSSSSCHHYSVTIFIHCIPPDLALVDMLCSCSPNLSCCESVRLCYFFLTLVRPHFAAVHFHGNYGKKLAPLICLNSKSVFLLSDSSYAHLCQIVSTYPFCLNSIFIHFRICRYTFILFWYMAPPAPLSSL